MSQKVTVGHEILFLLLQTAHHISQCACLCVLSLHLRKLEIQMENLDYIVRVLLP